MSKKYIERYWRKATKEDSIKDPMMEARFSNDPKFGFVIGKLANWHRDNQWPWVDENGRHWNTAEVYDAPDPGEGYELIDPMTECPGPGFEFLYGQHWHPAGEKVLEWDTFYRRKIQPEAAATKPEAAEPVTFVAHPIQINEELEYCFKGKPIQFRSYAVLNEQGHYLQHLPAYPPQYAPEFRQAFTPLQLLQLSVRELGRNIRLRAVEPVDEPKAKSDSAEPIAMFIHPIETMCVKGVHSYALRGEMIPNRSYAVMNKEGKYLYTLGDGEPVFLETFCQAFTPLQLREVHAQYIQDIHLRAVEPLDMDKIKQEPKEKLQPKAPAWEPKRQKVSWKDREYWVLTRFHVVKDRGHDPTELAVLQDITDRDGDQLRFVPSQHFEKAQPEATQPVKEPKYVPFTWEDREQLRGRVIAFTERNRKVEFRCEHFQHDSDGLLVNEFYAPWLCKNAVFTDTKEPVGKRVED